jgi:hypothetical protein
MITPLLTLFWIFASPRFAQADTIEVCRQVEGNGIGYQKLPCQLSPENALAELHATLLQNPEFHRNVRKSKLLHPSFERYRVLLLADKWVYGCGPGTGRDRQVTRIDVLLESTDHGPTVGQEPRLITVYKNSLWKGEGSEIEYVTRMRTLDWDRDVLDSLPAQEADSPVGRMMEQPMQSPCKP